MNELQATELTTVTLITQGSGRCAETFMILVFPNFRHGCRECSMHWSELPKLLTV